jgi:2-oxoglutarate dehydrogenase E2 component (dihydrolipoamide succinyltransferase)
MSVSVQLPELGESVVEGTLTKWLVKEGDRVGMDQPLVEIATDKVDVEIPSPVAGVVEKLLVSEGETVPVGTELLRIDSHGSGVAEAPALAPARSVPAAAPPEAGPGGLATPVARRMADEAAVDLTAVTGSGVSGRVTRADVEAHLADAEARRAKRSAPQPAPGVAPGWGVSAAARQRFGSYSLKEGDRVIPMSPLRKLVAEHMVYSKHVSPHVGTVAEIDLGGVVQVRDDHKRSFQRDHGFSLTFLPFVVHAAVRALRDFPSLNASVMDESIIEKQEIHIGIAVETEKGLVVPVVRHADRLSLAGLAEAVEDLSGRARSKRLSADELQGGTFTISNPGRNGNLYGFAIINQPQVGILRMGEIVKRPVVRSVERQDAIVIRPMMHLALSYDHRAVDGSPANGFLFRIRQLLEDAEFDL